MAYGEGARKWFVPDGYLPPKGCGDMEGHEALMLLNTAEEDARVYIDIYYEDVDPVIGIETIVKGQRVRCIRMDHPEELGGHVIPILTQYALRIRSDRKIIAQFGRLDVTQNNMAYYGCMPYAEP